MTSQSNATHTDYISLAEAVKLVSYSRDYVGRLAREGKILSQQIDKQWVVSRESLLNFYEQSSIEDSLKKRILSLSRKNDLEVKDFYTNKVSSIIARRSISGNSSLALAVFIMCGGLLGGVFLHAGVRTLASNPTANFAQVLSAIEFTPNTASVVTGTAFNQGLFSDVMVEEMTEKIPMKGGVVLFPTLAPGDADMVETLFSDEVSVVVTGTTTGFVRAEGSDLELPFVRIPQTSQ